MHRLLALVPALVLLSTAVAPARAELAGTTAPSFRATLAAANTDPGSLAAMLGRLPALPFDRETLATVTYANLAAQVAAVGAPTPSGLDDPAVRAWSRAIEWLALPHAQYMLHPEWRDAFGFDLTQVDQAVEYAAPPFALKLLRGRFAPATLLAAWERSGYRPVDVDGATIFTVREDLEIDLTAPGGRLALSRFNHAAILDDGTLAYSSVRRALEMTLDVAAGRTPSFAAKVDVEPLLRAVPADLVTAQVVPGTALAGSIDPAAVLLEPTPGIPDVDAVATEIARQTAELRRMPPVVTALLGMTAGGPLRRPESNGAGIPAPSGQPNARLVVALVMIHPGAAEEAARVVSERLATQRVARDLGANGGAGPTYAELFPERSVRAVPGQPVLIVELTPADDTPGSILFDLFNSRNLSFVAWSL